jgi:hypothetical protein
MWQLKKYLTTLIKIKGSVNEPYPEMIWSSSHSHTHDSFKIESNINLPSTPKPLFVFFQLQFVMHLHRNIYLYDSDPGWCIIHRILHLIKCLLIQNANDTSSNPIILLDLPHSDIKTTFNTMSFRKERRLNFL